ncbi:MAG: HAD family hydrolase [Halioglobus sp.]|nr:HAD family hydrolase [Halioglobus sp.]
MDLIVFDLDGTLLNKKSQVSEHTRDTLQQLRRRNIAYTVATGRTLQSARSLLDGQGFTLPHIYKNGVLTWRPESDVYSHSNLLTGAEIEAVLEAFLSVAVTPFIFTVEPSNRHVVYHLPMQNDSERRLAKIFSQDRGIEILPVTAMPSDAEITNISALGAREAIEYVADLVKTEEHLMAYAGNAIEGESLCWIDVHHSAASKGGAVANLKRDLGVSRIICFGDSDNDLSMFAMADESYAPSNAKDAVRSVATEVIGHHNEDGISRFLRKRFDLVMP